MKIETLKANDGKVIAYCGWTLTDKEGNVKNNGEFIYIYDIWCHKRNGSIPKFIKIIDKKAPHIKFVYWNRRKYHKLKLFEKRRFMKWISIG